MKKILITGGTGFIGYHLASHLLKQDCELVLVDNLQRGKMDADMQALLKNPQVKLLQLDLTDPSVYASLPQDFDQVYHLAAVNGTKWFYKMPEEVLRINMMTLIYILDWIKQSPRKPKVCFTSSNEAYAGALASFHQLPIPTPEAVPLVISDTYNPRWTYAATKLIGELFIIYYAKAFGFPAVIVRPHNFYGPRAGYDHVIPELSARIERREEPFKVFGADQTRTFCYITDAVTAMQMLMDSDATNSYPVETVHIGDNDEITMGELTERMFAVASWHPKELVPEKSPVGSVDRRRGDISKIKKLVGWEPTTKLNDGLKQTFEWYQAHPKPEQK